MSDNHYIILDRDGVINHDSPGYIKNANEWKPLPRSLEAISLLSKNEYKILLVSNQSGVSRGIIDYEDHLQIHAKLISLISQHGGNIFSSYYCFDRPDSKSNYRKPNPGMYLDFAERLNLDLSTTFAIGDSPRDMEAALSAGCKPLGVTTGNGKQIKDKMPNIEMFNDLLDAAQFVVDYDKQYILNI
tara:strand:+ start:190 stop:750 length:561 start_codon:yes stop_codon:yes gene_type:complete